MMMLQLLGVLLQCSTFHTRYEGLLHDCNAMRAGYLFQQDKHYDVSHDTGDKVPVPAIGHWLSSFVTYRYPYVISPWYHQILSPHIITTCYTVPHVISI
jgi:hypothetical protein